MIDNDSKREHTSTRTFNSRHLHHILKGFRGFRDKYGTKSHNRGRPMKTLALFVMLAVSMEIGAVTYFRPTIPGTQADSYTRPGMAIDGDRMYQTYPGTDAENVTKPGYVREGNTWVETLPSSTARKAKGRNFNVYGSDGRMFVPAPVDKDDYDRGDLMDLDEDRIDDF